MTQFARLLALLGLAACAATRPSVVRVATFNTSLNRPEAGDLARELAGGSADAGAIARIVQRVRPDVILLNEVDRDDGARAVELLCERYLAVPQEAEGEGLDYPFRFAGEVNTGVPSDLDLDGDGKSEGPGDAWGFGRHPGQYGMAVLSRYPIDVERVRTFRTLRWAAMPDNVIPPGFYDDATREALRLSSKSHWDVPVRLPDGRTLHVLASHPTPPVFDGPEDRNGRRNHDEIRFWADYLTPERAGWIVDDQGRRGGLPDGALFVVVGDLNCDPFDGDSRDVPVRVLLEHSRVDASFVPESSGARAAAIEQRGANATHSGPAFADTGDFRDEPGPGNLRLDYVLPSRGLEVVDCGVFWPRGEEEGAALVGVSDHRLVWVDVR